MFESRLLHGQPPRGLETRPETGCGLPLALPGGVPQTDPETDTRGGIERVAVKLRENAARGGVQMSHSDAIARVQSARARGDRIRAGGNR
jgi:hypothetical protein